MKRFVSLLAVCTLLTITVSIPEQAEATSQYDWCILIYMNGDSNLDDFTYRDFSEIGTVNPGVVVVALVDHLGDIPGEIWVRDSSTTNTFTHTLSGTGASITVTADEYPTSLLGIENEPNMGDPDTLSTFIANAKAEYVADHYFLDLWNHGNGFVSSMVDYGSGGATIDLQELDSAIGTQQFDIIGFDACQMGELAVVYQLHSNCDYYVASEDVEPIQGWTYSWVNNITATSTALNVGFSVVDTFSGTTLSVLDTSKINTFVGIFNDYVKQMMGLDSSDITNAYESSTIYPPYPPVFMDIKSFMINLPESNLRNTTIDYLDDAVMKTVGGNGVSIYFAPQEFYVDEIYRNNDLSRDTFYDEFLYAYQIGELGSLESLPIPTILTFVTEVFCTLLDFDVGWVEAKVDDGHWFHGTQYVDSGEHTVLTRYFNGEIYSDTNISTVSNVERVRTTVASELYTLNIAPLPDVNYISFPANANTTADAFLEAVDGISITRLVEGVYETYVKAVKNTDQNFDLLPGVGYIVQSNTATQYEFTSISETVVVDLNEGWNLLGVIQRTSASDFAEEFSGNNYIVSGGNTYVEEINHGDFTISPDTGIYVYSNQRESVVL